MATHSNILVWKKSWTEEPGKLQSVGSQRARQNWATKHTHVDMLGLHCCVQAFSSCSEWELLSSCGSSCCRAQALGCSGFSAHGTQAQQLQLPALQYRLSSCGPRPSLLLAMWYLPASGIESVSPALAAVFFTSEPPEKPPKWFLVFLW